MESLVSVIIPAYNVEKYIEGSLKSVCNQTYKNLQIIVVDDGSKDRTYEKIKEVASGDKRILALCKENGGVSSARNYALSYVEGQYVAFLDADDIMEKDAISILVSSMEKTDSDWVSCQYSRWDVNGNRLEDYNFIKGDRIFGSDEDRGNCLLKEFLNYLIGYEVWDKLYRTEIIRQNSLYFYEKSTIGEDLAFNIKYFFHVNKLNCIPDRLIRYMIRDNSSMGEHKDITDQLSESIILLEDIWNYIKESGNDNLMEMFPLLFAKRMEHDYIGHTPMEIVKALNGVENISFVQDRYKELPSRKKEIVKMSPAELAGIKYRFHMYVKGKVCGESALDAARRTAYNFYRILKGRDPIERWILPY